MLESHVHVHVHLDWGRSPESWRELVEAGKVWEQDPYGYLPLEEFYTLTYSTDKREIKFVTFARKVHRKLFGLDFIHAWRNRVPICQAEYIITHTENEFLAALLLLYVLGDKRRKVICQAVWLWDRWDGMSSVRQACYRALMARAAVLSVHSPENLKVAQDRVSFRPVALVPFGVRPFPALKSNEVKLDGTRIFSAGNDVDRDWAILADAGARLPAVSMRIRSSRRAAKRAFAKLGVTVRPSKSIDELWSDLRWCDVVVVPLKHNLHASGVTATLEALSAGLPVVVADVGGLKHYFQESVKYYKAGDVDSMLLAIGRAISDGPIVRPGGGANSYLGRRGLRSTDYAFRHGVLIESLQQGLSRIDEVSEMRPFSAEDVGH